MTQAGPALKLPLIRELDGIRALAVGIVFLSHVGLGKVIPGGLGVTIFFFLSGYLITSLLRAEASTFGRIDFKGFYIRRTLRIFPPLYITLAVSALLVAAGVLRASNLSPIGIGAQILFLSNYDDALGLGGGLPGPPLWSLAVEEHFYLIFPLLFALFLMRRPGRSAALWCALACIVPLAFRPLTAATGGDLGDNYFMTHTRFDSLLFGCALALWNNPVFDKDAWRPNILHFLLGCAAILVAAAIRNEVFAETLRYTIQGIGLYVVFSFVLTPNRLTSPILNWEPLQFLGRLSYSLYLGHVIAIKVVDGLLPDQGQVVVALLALALSIAYAGAMFVLVERPLARLRSRWHKGPAPQPMLADLESDPAERSARLAERSA